MSATAILRVSPSVGGAWADGEDAHAALAVAAALADDARARAARRRRLLRAVAAGGTVGLAGLGYAGVEALTGAWGRAAAGAGAGALGLCAAGLALRLARPGADVPMLESVEVAWVEAEVHAHPRGCSYVSLPGLPLLRLDVVPDLGEDLRACLSQMPAAVADLEGETSHLQGLLDVRALLEAPPAAPFAGPLLTPSAAHGALLEGVLACAEWRPRVTDRPLDAFGALVLAEEGAFDRRLAALADVQTVLQARASDAASFIERQSEKATWDMMLPLSSHLPSRVPSMRWTPDVHGVRAAAAGMDAIEAERRAEVRAGLARLEAQAAAAEAALRAAAERLQAHWQAQHDESLAAYHAQFAAYLARKLPELAKAEHDLEEAARNKATVETAIAEADRMQAAARDRLAAKDKELAALARRLKSGRAHADLAALAAQQAQRLQEQKNLRDEIRRLEDTRKQSAREVQRYEKDIRDHASEAHFCAGLIRHESATFADRRAITADDLEAKTGALRADLEQSLLVLRRRADNLADQLRAPEREAERFRAEVLGALPAFAPFHVPAAVLDDRPFEDVNPRHAKALLAARREVQHQAADAARRALDRFAQRLRDSVAALGEARVRLAGREGRHGLLRIPLLVLHLRQEGESVVRVLTAGRIERGPEGPARLCHVPLSPALQAWAEALAASDALPRGEPLDPAGWTATWREAAGRRLLSTAQARALARASARASIRKGPVAVETASAPPAAAQEPGAPEPPTASTELRVDLGQAQGAPHREAAGEAPSDEAFDVTPPAL